MKKLFTKNFGITKSKNAIRILTFPTFLLILAGGIMMTACKKDISNSSLIKKENNSVKSINELPIKIRVGTHLFENCNYNLPCGPCPGICIQTKAELKKEVNDEEFKNGDRIIFISLKENSLLIRFTSWGHNYDGKVYFEDDYSLGEEISNYFGLKDLIIQKGEYKLSFENNIFGDAYVNVILIK